MSGLGNISHQSLAVSGNCLPLLLANSPYLTKSDKDISIRDKRSSCSDSTSVGSDCLPKHKGGSALSLFPTYIEFSFYEMANSRTNLQSGARGVSDATQAVRKTASKRRQTKADILSKKSHPKFADLNNLRIFVVPKFHKTVCRSIRHTDKIRDKAEYLPGMSSGNSRCGTLASLGKGSAHSVFCKLQIS